jgi:cyclopropane fatty-acyl-phospholipid synthase-like methyltransferase
VVEAVTYAEVWDAQAADLAAAKWAAWAEADEDRATYRHLLHLADMPAAGPLLDLGCGWGRLAIPMAKAQPRSTVWAVDASPAMLGHLATEADGQPNLHGVLTDGGTELPRSVPALAGAWSVLCFQHMPADQQRSYLGQMADRLQPAAPLVVQFVTDTEPGPLSHPVEPQQLVDWCRQVDLLAEVRPDLAQPTWLWLHARKARFQ